MKPYALPAANESGTRSVPRGLQRLLTAQEIAELFGVSRAWVLAHANGNRRPRLPSVKLGKVVRFESGAVERFLGECAR
jgi:predicted DNA-binding transcriptional regulator AlpA